MDAGKLHMALAAVCPLVGVSMGDPNDSNTWTIQVADTATADQQAALQQKLDDIKAHGLPPDRRLVPKSLVLSRLTDDQLDKALSLMTNRQKERWRAPDKPDVFADDPETVGLVKAIGADPNVVLAP
ncbi:MAG: hypothetical protein ACXWQZ_01310 [Ktedonobacterales bacterium]